MRLRNGLFTFVTILLLTGVAFGAEQSRQITLDPTGERQPTVDLLSSRANGLSLELRVPELKLEEIEVDGASYQHISLDGGGVIGEVGQPALPSFTRLIAVPDGMAVTAHVESADKRRIPNMRLLPMQPEEGEFVIDEAAYERAGMTGPPLVEIGAPAIMRDMRVVAVTFNPVQFDASRQEIMAASRIEVSIDFSGSDNRNGAPRHQRPIPKSFDALYSQTILNYDQLERDVADGPGGILYICRNNTSVISRLEPLLEWRRRQGYYVEQTTTDHTGASNSSIKNYIQNAYDSWSVPLEFVVLVGDADGSYGVATWFESISGYGGEGDHYYTTIEGGDQLPDVHIGRLSFSDMGDLDVIIDKCVQYESEPWTSSDTGWFKRACLVGDPSTSGITCVFVNQWAKQQLLAQGYAEVDTIFSGSFASQMMSKFNRGDTFITYRGYWGNSGFNNGYISSLSNGYKLPFCIFITCGTGSFANGTSNNEAFLRSSNGGAIGCVATATIGTHTRYNNCMYNGITEGLINSDEHRQGAALSRGKLEMFLNYGMSQPNTAETWCVWNSLMGDPAVDIFTDIPEEISVGHAGTVALGANSVLVQVNDESGWPLEGAQVALYKEGEIRSVGYSNADGQANLPISGYSSGELLVTVTGHNLYPYLGSLNLGSVGSYVVYDDSSVDDDNSGESSGNNNGIVNPGESLEVAIALANLGSNTATGVVGHLLSADPLVSITDSQESYGDIAGGSSAWGDDDFDFTVSPAAPDGHVLSFDIVAQSGIQTWTTLLELTVQSAAFEQTDFTFGGSGGDLDPGESGIMIVELENTGSIGTSLISAVLSSESPWISITDAEGTYNPIGAGGSGENNSDPFSIAISPDCFEGHLAQFNLVLEFNSGYQAMAEFVVEVGSASSNDPVGPDNYGYYAFDNTDTSYPYAPAYSWVEISPSAGGSGTSVGLTDYGWEQDDTNVMTLPFTFRYYGQDFTQVSICSNGWVAMGTSSLKHYRNWAIPAAGGPSNMIAPFWDNLYQTSSYKVYYWNDTANNRYIIEWDRVKNDHTNSTQKFEMILYDPAHHETATGDGRIVFQYHTVNNTDSQNGYATVGIQNQERTDGIGYTYWNQYAAGAASLSSGRAISFEPVGTLDIGYLAGEVANATDHGYPVVGAEIFLPESGQTLVTNEEGSFYGGVVPGTYTAIASHPSFTSDTTSGVVVQLGESTVLNFELDDIVGPNITGTTNYPFTGDTNGPYVIETTITDASNLSEARFFYMSTADGGPNEIPLELIDAGSGLYEAEIPGQPENTLVNYWVFARDYPGNASSDPPDAPVVTYSFWVMNEVEIFSDDMESDNGWTVGDAGDDAITGIWERVNPNGVWEGSTEIQPEDDYTADPGVTCWVTGNDPAGSQQGTDDVDGGTTTLLSPWFDLSDLSGGIVNYRRWYSNDTGNEPGQDVWVVQVTNDGSNWVTLENTNVSERSWYYRSFELDDYIEPTATVRFRFIASDEGQGSVVEAAVDEFYLSAYGDPDATALPGEEAPARMTLLQNSPNPFNPVTSIKFGLPEPAEVELKVYDTQGRLLRILANKTFAAGYHELTWDGQDATGQSQASGIYFYALESGSQSLSGKMVLLK